MRTPSILQLSCCALLLAGGSGAQDDRPYLAVHARNATFLEGLSSLVLEVEQQVDPDGASFFALGGNARSIDWAPLDDDLVAEVFVVPAGLRDGICDDLGIAAGVLRGAWCTGAVQGGAPPRYCAQVFAAIWSFPEQIEHVRFVIRDRGDGDFHVQGELTPATGSAFERWLAGVEPDPRGTLGLRDPSATLWLGTAMRGPSVQSAWLGWWEHVATMRARQLRGTPADDADARAEAVGLAAALRDGRIALRWSTADRSIFAVGSHDPQALAELEEDPAFRALMQARLGEGPRTWEPLRIAEDQQVVQVEDDALATDRILLRAVRGDYLIEAADEANGPATGKLLARLAQGRARSFPLPDGLWLQAEFSRPPLEELRRIEIPFPLPIEMGIDDLAESVHGMLPARATLALRRAAPDSQALAFELDLFGL